MIDLDTAFASFAPTPAAAARRSALQQRLTMKFLLPADLMPQIAGELAGTYTLLLARGKRSARYRTLNFDTEDLHFFHAHRRGYRRREKVRIRHYDDRELSFFEVKQRIHTLKSVKRRWPHAYDDNTPDAEDLALARQYTGIQARLLPQTWTLYRRLNLVSRESDERVTVDFDLRFSDGSNVVEALNVVVVEIKQPQMSRSSPAMIALRRRGFRPGKFSKYCAAIVALHPEVRHNRLRPRLRAMRAIGNE